MMFFLLGIAYCIAVSFVLAMSFFFFFLIAKLITLLFKALLPDNRKETIDAIAFIIVLVFLLLVTLIFL